MSSFKCTVCECLVFGQPKLRTPKAGKAVCKYCVENGEYKP